MAKRACLPRCFNPVFPDPCQNGVTVCCIQWTMPCGTLTYDGAFFLDPRFECFYPGLDDGYGGRLPLCKSNLSGNTNIYEIGGSMEDPPAICTWQEGNGCERLGIFWDGYAANGFAIGDYPTPVSFCKPWSLVGAEEEGCTEWTDQLTDLTGHPKEPDPTLVYRPGTDDYVFTVDTYSCLPEIRWSCSGRDRISWEVGWRVFQYQEVWILSGLPDPIPDPVPRDFYDDVASNTLAGFYWTKLGFYAISTGETGKNWYTLGTPFTLENSVGTGGDTFNSVITPIKCNYEPCGDPLDCFAACISGTKDCDGSTPAHKPYIYFMLDILGCCLSKTYALRYGSGRFGAGYYGEFTCVVSESVSFAIRISVTCGVNILGEVIFPPGIATLWVEFGTITAFGTAWSTEIAEGVTLTCSGGSLVPVTGEVNDTDCGDGDGEWVLYG